MLNLIIKILSIFLISISVSIAKDLNHSESLDLYNNKILIIDVRNKSEWKETGIIPGVKLVQMLTPNMTLRNDFIDDLVSVIGNDKSIEVGIICRSGNRSSAAVAMLKEKGYKNIYNIAEGMVGTTDTSGWISRGYPTIKCNEECK